MRNDGRGPAELRPVEIIPDWADFAEGSALIRQGRTQVLVTASIDEGVPPFLKGKGQGWLTAEYAMLPRATQTRTPRETRGPKGRTQEIQRLIGRSLRQAVDLTRLGERTLTIDADVLQADGGTRTASITGGYVALADAVQHLLDKALLKKTPLTHQVASVSTGLYHGTPVLDLDYAEDSSADTDMNFVMNEAGRFIEVQGTAERGAFSEDEMTAMAKLARHGIAQLIARQREALGIK